MPSIFAVFANKSAINWPRSPWPHSRDTECAGRRDGFGLANG
ncbi:MAG: hypothetical protein ACJAQZ_000254 [Planctomycetota bacterium]|jgi:hypothetical protein